MIISSVIKSKYQEYETYLKILKRKIDETLISYCSENGLAYVSRIKTLESLSEKIETGRFNNLDEIDDFIGATIIIPNQNYEENVIDYLLSIFLNIEVKKKGSSFKSPDVFRFDSTRFIGKLKNTMAEDNLLFKINFEIQVKTAFEHAWSVASYSISYKTRDIDWKLLRLSAQLKSSVEQLDMLISGYDKIHGFISESQWPDIELKKLFLKFINRKIETNNIPIEVIPKDLSRFCDNFTSIVFSGLYKRSNFEEKKKILEKIVNDIEIELDKFNLSSFPRSISLLQLLFAVMIEKNIIRKSDIGFKYKALITEELEILYPKMKDIENRFII